MNHLEEAKLLRQEPGGRHYNCAQSLLVPFAAEIGMEKEATDALGVFFGAGMMHGSACGTLTAALMILGKAGKDKETAKKLVDDFLAAYGTTDCDVFSPPQKKEASHAKKTATDLFLTCAKSSRRF